MPTDITGKIYKPFDMMHIGDTISAQIQKWAENDLGLTRKA